MVKTKNRWLIAASAVGIHISIGSVYAYSVMIIPMEELLGWEIVDITFAFSIAILFLGLSSAFLGFLVDTKGPRFSGSLSAMFYTLGILGTGLAVQTGSYTLFVFAYGVLGGIGLGLGYITPVSTLIKWFPERRGLATGMAIMGFGFAALIFGPLMAFMFEEIGMPSTFYILGGLYFCLMMVSASYLEPPPENWHPEKINGNSSKVKKSKTDLSNSSALEALKTARFYFLWIMLFINITCGIGIISVASPLAQEVTGVTVLQASAIVGLMGLFNGIGRIVWASLSDVIGRPVTYATFFAIQIIGFSMIIGFENVLMFQIMLYLILTCYGGGFATVPAFLGDLFGTKQVGTIHGYLLTAWSAAGITGPMIISVLRETTGSYAMSMQIFSGFFVVALISTGLLWLNMKKVRKQNHITN